MNITRLSRQISRISLVLLSICLFTSCSQEKIRILTLGTGGLGGNYQIAGHAIARAVNEATGTNEFKLQNSTSLGSASNINAIVAGDIEFGLAQADHQYQALRGLAEWQETGPQKDLRAVFSLYNESVTLVAGGDSGIRFMGDLKGKRVDIGLPGSGTRQNAIDALGAAGIDWENDIEMHEEPLDDRLAMLIHNQLDAFFYTVGHPNSNIKFATFSVRGARLIPLINREKILLANPYYSKSIIRIAQYPRAENETDVDTIGVRATLLTSSRVSDEIVYAVTKAVFEQFAALGEHMVLSVIVGEDMLEGLTAPIHPGALRYYQEIGLQVPGSN